MTGQAESSGKSQEVDSTGMRENGAGIEERVLFASVDCRSNYPAATLPAQALFPSAQVVAKFKTTHSYEVFPQVKVAVQTVEPAPLGLIAAGSDFS